MTYLRGHGLPTPHASAVLGSSAGSGTLATNQVDSGDVGHVCRGFSFARFPWLSVAQMRARINRCV